MLSRILLIAIFILTSVVSAVNLVGCSRNLVPKTDLERKVAYFVYTLNKKKSKTISVKKQDGTKRIERIEKSIIKQFHKMVDIQLVTQKVLGMYLKSFTSEEIDVFQRNFLLTLLKVADKKIRSSEYTRTEMKFVKYPWEKKSRIVAIEINIPDEKMPIQLILEFDKKRDVLINFYFNEISLISQYREQFMGILESKGKNEFLSIIQNRLDNPQEPELSNTLDSNE